MFHLVLAKSRSCNNIILRMLYWEPKKVAAITLYNVCSVHRGMFSTSGSVQYIGGYHEYIGGYHEYIGGIS